MRRVVITGLGIVSPVGCGVEASWKALLAATNGARSVRYRRAILRERCLSGFDLCFHARTLSIDARFIGERFT